MLLVSTLNNLLSAYELSDIIIIGAGLFFIYKEIKKDVAEWRKEKKEKSEEYREEKNKEDSTQTRLDILEKKAENSWEKIKDYGEKLDSLEEDVSDLRIESMRSYILDSVQDCINMENLVSVEKYHNIFKKYSKYEAIIKKKGLTNSEISLSMALLRRSYIKRKEQNKFAENCYLPSEKAKERIQMACSSMPVFMELDDYDELMSQKEFQDSVDIKGMM